MKKSEIKEMANAFVELHKDLSGINKIYLFNGYANGAMQILYKLGIEVEVDE